jgi:ubiquinone/menaquinone biosynthesis C-methylase UbiE
MEHSIKELRKFYDIKHQSDTTYFELYVPALIDKYLKQGIILDLGSGQQTRNIAISENKVVVFSDISLTAMKIARSKNMHKKAYFVVLDADNLPFHENVFDSILCKDILEHVAEDYKCAQEVTRCLKSGGTIGVWAPLKLFDKEIIDWGHLRGYSLDGITKIFPNTRVLLCRPNRTWKGRWYYDLICKMTYLGKLPLPWSLLPNYKKLKEKFLINSYEYVLYLYELLIDQLILYFFPKLGTCCITIFKK